MVNTFYPLVIQPSEMENHPFFGSVNCEKHLLISINGPFSIAMLKKQRVSLGSSMLNTIWYGFAMVLLWFTMVCYSNMASMNIPSNKMGLLWFTIKYDLNGVNILWNNMRKMGSLDITLSKSHYIKGLLYHCSGVYFAKLLNITRPTVE